MHVRTAIRTFLDSSPRLLWAPVRGCSGAIARPGAGCAAVNRSRGSACARRFRVIGQECPGTKRPADVQYRGIPRTRLNGNVSPRAIVTARAVSAVG